jgi:hypothetical protein
VFLPGENIPSYNHEMARGWESKSVESQIEGAREAPSHPKPQLTPEQQQAAREIERLKLSRSYVKQQIAGASHPSRIQTLQHALQEIEEKLERLRRG